MADEFNEIVKEKKIICPICGAAHTTTACNYTNITNHISNRATSTKARLSLPNGFAVYTLADGRYKVITNKFIRNGTRFGPLEAARSFTLNPAVQFPLKIFPFEEDDFLEYYLDTADEETSTWMIFIEAAENYEEQNLMCYQEEQHIYYISVKDINENESLKVWYSPYYATKMGKKLLEEKLVEKKPPDIAKLNELVKLQQNIPDIDSWTCKFCNIMFVEVTKFADHLIKEHYGTQIGKICGACKANFKTKKCACERLKIVENPPANKISLTMNRAIEAILDQNSNKEISIGDPLLNSTRSMDNFDLIIPTLSELNEDLQIMGVENLNTENLLITENFEELDYFDFEIEEMKEGINCDICFKNFSKIPYLVQHLKAHRGDNYCSSCNKVFGRKESLTYHSCNTKLIHKCSPCNRAFTQKKYYKRHIDVAHNQKNKCKNCNKTFELNHHNCEVDQHQLYACEFCKKIYSCQRSLRRHISRKHGNERFFICEFCPKQYTTKFSYQIHVKTHEKAEFKCEVCQKEFHRKDVLREHVNAIHNNQELKCDRCNKKFRSKKNLSSHKQTHTNTKYKCNSCSALFNSRSNLTRHRKIHLKNGNVSTQQFPYKCTFCGKLMKLRSSLMRHIQKKHKIPESASEDNGMREKEDVLRFLNLDLDSQDNIDLINDVDMDEVGRKHIQVIDNILLKKSEEMGLGVNNYTLNMNDTKSNSPVKTNVLGRKHIQVTNNVLLQKSEDVNNYILNLTDTKPSSSVKSYKGEISSGVEDREVFLTIPDLMDIENDIILGDDDFLVDSEIVPSLKSGGV